MKKTRRRYDRAFKISVVSELESLGLRRGRLCLFLQLLSLPASSGQDLGIPARDLFTGIKF